LNCFNILDGHYSVGRNATHFDEIMKNESGSSLIFFVFISVCLPIQEATITFEIDAINWMNGKGHKVLSYLPPTKRVSWSDPLGDFVEHGGSE